MSTSTNDHAEASAEAGPPALRIGRWRLRTGRRRLPGGRAAAVPSGRKVRRAFRRTLRRWGLGSAADELADHLTALVQDVLARSPMRGRGAIDLRLELRASARMLLGEIHPLPARPGARDPAGGGTGGRGIIVLTYGRRPGRGGAAIRYVHRFTWWRTDSIITD
ncbi:hypothetical protein ETD83_25765 [Actinomadura soli]|uniref:Uncharacterized protein n=1 Tax=Actinomadura soli TaxID=2508997 RepID=A0A5C4J762_9ACTN|nr:hypothetical protein [Actinomadura soli]TMQ93289.1 hypothetical protein ETD83_25765 [Actinomadura soli]